jgi:hypothetical protein
MNVYMYACMYMITDNKVYRSLCEKLASSSSSVALQSLAASHRRFRNPVKKVGRNPLDE